MRARGDVSDMPFPSVGVRAQGRTKAFNCASAEGGCSSSFKTAARCLWFAQEGKQVQAAQRELGEVHKLNPGVPHRHHAHQRGPDGRCC